MKSPAGPAIPRGPGIEVLESVAMNPTLESLVRLQQAENDLRRVESELQAVPRAKAEMEARLAAERGRLDAAKAALDACQKSRSSTREVQDLETKRSKYKGQLMEVKTNKEYTAMLHEIEAVEREIRSREDQILVEMEQAEGLAAEVKREEASSRRKRSGQAEAGPRRRGRRARRPRRGLAAERDTVAATVPEDALELFKRVAKLRGTRWPRPGRDVRGLPREAAAPDVRGDQAERRDHAVPLVRPRPLLRAARPRWSTRSRERRRRRPSTSTSTAAAGATRGCRLRRPRTRRAGEERAALYGYLGRATNNVAEYQALLHALRYALAQGATRVRVFSDSELVVKQMDGRYRVKHPDMIPLHREAKASWAASRRPPHPRAPRAEVEADRLANQALDEKARSSIAPAVAAGESHEADHPAAAGPSRR